MVVDDEIEVLNLVSRMLREAGYEVILARNGEEAWDRIQRVNPAIDALVADVVMPRMSGTELAARAVGRRPSLPVILMSAYSAADMQQRGLELTHGHLLTKPFEKRELLSLLDRLLGPG